MKTWTYMSQSLKCLIFYRVGWKETNKKKIVWFLDLNPGGLKVCIGMQEWIKLLYFSFPLVSQARACFLPKLSPIPLGCAGRRCERLGAGWRRQPRSLPASVVPARSALNASQHPEELSHQQTESALELIQTDCSWRPSNQLHFPPHQGYSMSRCLLG